MNFENKERLYFLFTPFYLLILMITILSLYKNNKISKKLLSILLPVICTFFILSITFIYFYERNYSISLSIVIFITFMVIATNNKIYVDDIDSNSKINKIILGFNIFFLIVIFGIFGIIYYFPLLLENKNNQNVVQEDLSLKSIPQSRQKESSSMPQLSTESMPQSRQLSAESRTQLDPFKNFFEYTFGFKESTYDNTKNRLLKYYNLDKFVIPLENGSYKILHIGNFTTPTVKTLRENVDKLPKVDGDIGIVRFARIKSNAKTIHLDPRTAKCVIQAASQFNCLEFINETKTPEHGISCYAQDHTQGPVCAIACAAGTAYRNYLYQFPDDNYSHKFGQTKSKQINCLSTIEFKLFGNNQNYWTVKNGYVDSNDEDIIKLNKSLNDFDDDDIIQLLRVGVQADTQITICETPVPKLVTQVYGSAISVSYSNLRDKTLWKRFATSILKGTFEAVLLQGLLNNHKNNGNYPVYITRVGGGAFGNEPEWIEEAILYALNRVKTYNRDIDVILVDYDKKSANDVKIKENPVYTVFTGEIINLQ